MSSQPSSQPAGTPQGVADAVTQLAQQTSGLARSEVDAARTELVEKLRANAPGAALLGGAAVAGVLALVSLDRLLFRSLSAATGPVGAAVVLLAGYGAAAGAAGVTGWRRLQEAPTPVPSETAARARDEASAVSDQVRRSS